jgi:hypothetical protein
MPQLPTYSSKGSLAKDQPEVIRSGAGDVAKSVANLAGTVQDISQKWAVASDTIKYTTDKANYELETAKIEAEAMVDPNPDNGKVYIDKINKLKQNKSKGYINKTTESRLDFEMGMSNKINELKIKTIFKKKQIDLGQVKLQQGIDILQQKKLTASSPEEYAKVKKEINDLLVLNVQAGIVSQEEAFKIQKKAELNGAEDAVYTNPQQAIADLNAGLYDIPATEKEKMKIKAIQLIKARADLADWQLKQTHTQGAFDLSQGLVDGTLTTGDIRKFQQSGMIDSETAAIFDGVVSNGEFAIPDNTLLGKPDYFLKLIDESIDSKSEVMKIIKDATTAYGKSELGANQYAYFIQEANKKFERQRKGLKGNSEEQEKMKSAIEGIKAFTDTFSPVEMAKNAYSLFSKFIERVQTGTDPDKAKSQVIEENLNEQIEKTKLELPPQSIKMISKEGQEYMIPQKNMEEALKRGFKRAE